ncbi:hypothetical protein C1645_823700 [Glomus cerebriforme]|uniref:Uncharacterized protein n=1 Tax=Glomus cerebriforme TaxID=658196 RepID=A0A397SYN5_9GLOM|nr:hypothetical protein C1645_823700 [Glomus cerebriforme]
MRKRKTDEIDNGQDVNRVFGIITNVSEWYFMECSLDNEGKPSFKLSEPVTIVYKDENLQAKVEKILGHIVWILEEAQKSVEASQSGIKSYIADLESKNAELKNKNMQLRQIIEKNTRHDAENAKHKVRIEELEKYSADISAKNNLCSVKKEEISELTAVTSYGIPDSVIDQGSFCEQHIADNADTKSLEDKKTDSFLDEMYKKKISNKIRQRSRKRNSKKMKALCDKNKIGEKKARGLIYDEVVKQDSKFTNDEIQKIMDHFSNKSSIDLSNDQKNNSINDDTSSQTDVSNSSGYSSIGYQGRGGITY